MKSKEILNSLKSRTIGYVPIYKDIVGSFQGAIFLSQLMFWFSTKNKMKNKIWKLDKDFQDELHFSEFALKKVKQQIKELPFIKITKEGMPAKTYYSVNWSKYEKCLKKAEEALKTTVRRSPLPDRCTYADSGRRLYAEHKRRTYADLSLYRDDIHIKNISKEIQSNEIALLEDKKYSSLKTFENVYSKRTLKILKCWIDRGGKVHQKQSLKNIGAERITSMIEELCIEGRNPFISILTEEEKEAKLGIKAFTVKEIKACIKKYYKMGKVDEIKNMYFDEFIFFKYMGRNNRGLQNHSPLLTAFHKISMKEKHTKLSRKLKDKLEDFRPNEKVADMHFIRAAEALTKLADKYKPNPQNNYVHFKKIENVFIPFVKEKANSREFKLFSIGLDWFLDDFLETALKRYSLVSLKDSHYN